jgi:branched-chain amino acid transport system ATP-binding protein
MSEPLLQAENLHIRFGGVTAADGLTIDVIADEVLAIVGPNGAGKTTFINICTGYVRPSRGRVSFRGRDLTRLPPRHSVSAGIGRTFQMPQLFWQHTVLDNLLLAAAVSARVFWRPWRPLRAPGLEERARAVLAQLRIDGVADRLVLHLPEGMRKLVDVGIALVQEPQLLLMDEPTTSVSSQEKFAIMETLMLALKERRVTAVFVEHDMDVVRAFAARVAVANNGRFDAIGPPDAVLPAVVGRF